jgi:hypothetical protein
MSRKFRRNRLPPSFREEESQVGKVAGYGSPQVAYFYPDDGASMLLRNVVSNQTTWSHHPEDQSLDLHSREFSDLILQIAAVL